MKYVKTWRETNKSNTAAELIFSATLRFAFNVSKQQQQQRKARSERNALFEMRVDSRYTDDLAIAIRHLDDHAVSPH